jgi:hypothetical protein
MNNKLKLLSKKELIEIISKMKKEELKTNDLLIFTTLLNEASKWLYALQLKGLKQEVKWVFNNALKALQSYERILKKTLVMMS